MQRAVPAIKSEKKKIAKKKISVPARGAVIPVALRTEIGLAGFRREKSVSRGRG